MPSGMPPIGAWLLAAGLGLDDENTLRVLEVLGQLVMTWRQWVNGVGGFFNMMEREQPGQIYSLPEQSIYEGLDMDVAALMGHTDEGDTALGQLAGADKGKGHATREAMDIDR